MLDFTRLMITNISCMKSKNLLIASFAAAVLLIQLMIPSTLSSREEMLTARKGFPLAFVQQDITAIDFPIPYVYRFSSPWENPTELLLPGLVVDFGAFFFLASFLLKIVGRKRNEQGDKKTGSN